MKKPASVLGVMLKALIPAMLLQVDATHAQPDFSQRSTLHGIVLCPDLRQAGLAYYLPNELAMTRRANGKPDLRFIMMRYTGTAAAGDQGTIRFRNILQFGVAMKPVNADSLNRARQELKRSLPQYTLRPLLMSHVDAVVYYAPVGDTASTRLGKGDIEAETETGNSTSSSYWQERTFTLFVDNLTAQVFHTSLQKNMLALSVGYAFYSRGKAEGNPEANVSGRYPGKFHKMMEELLPKPDSSDNALKDCLVTANAFEVEIDTASYRDFVEQIDMNESLPPGYSVLSIYDYDFNNEIRPDLYEKIVEFEAVGAGGGTVHSNIEFKSRQPDVYSKSLKFKYAVRLDKPYRYRTWEISLSGEEKVGEWITVSDWTPILDVTTKPEELDRIRNSTHR